jgi:hypothetical protein
MENAPTPTSSRNSPKVKRRRTDRVATWLQGVTAIVACGALVISLLTFQNQLNRKASKQEVALIQKQRYDSAVDACTILKTTIIAAFGPKFHKQAKNLIYTVGINDCNAYAAGTVGFTPKP